MKLKQKMMINAYSTYLKKQVDTVSSFSTRKRYLDKATDYYKDSENHEKPPHLDAAEKEIGFTKTE